jgi:hypothetical protein
VNTFGGQKEATNPLASRGVEDTWNNIVKADKDLRDKIRTTERDIDTSLSNIYDRVSAAPDIAPTGARTRRCTTCPVPPGSSTPTRRATSSR